MPRPHEIGSRMPHPGHPEPDQHPPGPSRRVTQQAARLRLVTDRRLGKTSPDWVRRAAADDPLAYQVPDPDRH
jgi:hypothetical protein